MNFIPKRSLAYDLKNSVVKVQSMRIYFQFIDWYNEKIKTPPLFKAQNLIIQNISEFESKMIDYVS